MAHVSVMINGRKYHIACDDGQEAHLTRLGAYVDKRISELIASVGQVGDARLLVMASLLLADELSDAYAEIDTSQSVNGDGAVSARKNADKVIGPRIEKLALRIENIAKSLEQS